jgi:RNA polymerase sigma-70 factor (ECF subfamily)
MSPGKSLRIPDSLSAVVNRCWEKAAVPPEWGLCLEQFEKALETSAGNRFSVAAAGANPGTPDQEEIRSYLESLHVADLALACACSAGSAPAWDFFVAQFRPELYRAARAIAGESGARELADSLYAELYGLRESEGQRKSLFDYFHGRSKLGTWLRAILAQRHVDELRRARRMEPLEEEDEGRQGETRAPAKDAAPDPEREKYLAMLQAILMGAINRLEPQDRLRLAYYYVDERTLAEIGKLLGEHEATVSRKLERTRRTLRKGAESALRNERKLSEAQMRQCFEYARDEWPFDLTGPLSARE